MNLHQPIFPRIRRLRLIRADDPPKDLHCFERRMIGCPGDELIGADQYKGCLIAFTPSRAAVANELERNSQHPRSALELAHDDVVLVECKQREVTTEFFEDIAPRRQRLRRQVMSRPRRETMRSRRAAS